MIRYRVRRRAGSLHFPWAVEKPNGVAVWSSRSQRVAVGIAHMFARRAQLHADLLERGLSGGEPTA